MQEMFPHGAGFTVELWKPDTSVEDWSQIQRTRYLSGANYYANRSDYWDAEYPEVSNSTS